MSPRQRSLVSLVVIALAIGATALAWRLEPPPAPPPSEGLQPVFDVPASAVRAIDLDTWQGSLRAKRSGAGWQVAEVRLGKGADRAEAGLQPPTAAEIDTALDTLVAEVIATPQIDRFSAEGVPLHDFGLDPPQAHITLDLDSGEHRTLEIGELTITTSALYARVLPGQDVFQIGSLVFNDVAAALFRLRALDTSTGAKGDG
jgi:hypothetical protein